ncbi:RsiV family protein [Rhodococcus sp. ACT016]|uniref:RsiV family protein n=1 Tax=Rhodococcus sp. ACT016 TaxID=3134808 RepID=UPI003D298E22
MANTPIVRGVVTTLTAGILLAVAGCSGTTGTTGSKPESLEVTVSAAPTAMSALSSTAATSATSVAFSGNETGYTATTVRISGDNGRVRYDVLVPQVEGGDPAVTAEFDESMRAALQDQIDGWPGQRFSLESTDRSAVVHIGSRVVSGLLVTSWNADPPGAHPSPLVATVVVDADDAQPITLDRLFPDLQAGLNRLSEESARLLPDTAAGPEFEREGIEPKRENFANWVATPAGMEIHFTDYQVGPHAIGLVVVTVPWDRLSDVVAPDLLGVVSS